MKNIKFYEITLCYKISMLLLVNVLLINTYCGKIGER